MDFSFFPPGPQAYYLPSTSLPIAEFPPTTTEPPAGSSTTPFNPLAHFAAPSAHGPFDSAAGFTFDTAAPHSFGHSQPGDPSTPLGGPGVHPFQGVDMTAAHQQQQHQQQQQGHLGGGFGAGGGSGGGNGGASRRSSSSEKETGSGGGGVGLTMAQTRRKAQNRAA